MSDSYAILTYPLWSRESILCERWAIPTWGWGRNYYNDLEGAERRDKAACHAPALWGCGPVSCTIVHCNWPRDDESQRRISRRSNWDKGESIYTHRQSAGSRHIGCSPRSRIGAHRRKKSPTFRFAVSAVFILLQRQQRVEHSLVPVHVFHWFARHHCTVVHLLHSPHSPCRLFVK